MDTMLIGEMLSVVVLQLETSRWRLEVYLEVGSSQPQWGPRVQQVLTSCEGPFFGYFSDGNVWGPPTLLVNKLMILALCEKADARNAQY